MDDKHMGGGYTEHPIAKERVSNDRSDKSESTALTVMQLAIDAHKTATQPPSATELCSYAEMIWQWTTTDTWPPKAKT